MPPGQLDHSEPLTHLFQGADLLELPSAHEGQAEVTVALKWGAKEHQIKHIYDARLTGKAAGQGTPKPSVLRLWLRRHGAVGLLKYSFNFEGR